jgi:hypothetical protein
MAMIWLLVLQAVQVVFLWLHDWVPVGRLNDVAAVRRADPLPRLVLVTLVQSMPYTAGLVFSLMFYRSGGGLPGWVWSWLWISYGLLFAGELRAWWVPYLVRPEPARAVRYRAMFGRTHAFLPERNGISPNTLHCALHAATAGTLVLLAVLNG